MKTIFLPSVPVIPAFAATALLAAILSLQAQPDRPVYPERSSDAKYALEQPPSAAGLGTDLFADGSKRIIFRLDDAGLCHAVNAALERILKEGTASAVGVRVAFGRLWPGVAALCVRRQHAYEAA